MINFDEIETGKLLQGMEDAAFEYLSLVMPPLYKNHKPINIGDIAHFLYFLDVEASVEDNEIVYNNLSRDAIESTLLQIVEFLLKSKYSWTNVYEEDIITYLHRRGLCSELKEGVFGV